MMNFVPRAGENERASEVGKRERGTCRLADLNTDTSSRRTSTFLLSKRPYGHHARGVPFYRATFPPSAAPEQRAGP